MIAPAAPPADPRPTDDALVVVVDQDTKPADVDRLLDAVDELTRLAAEREAAK